MNMMLFLFLISVIFSYGYTQETCINSVTEASIGRTCSKQVIFEDQFDNLNSQKWRNSVRISSAEEEEFVVYDNKQKNIYVKDGKLFIQPTLMSEETVNSGVIDLKMCTGRYQTSDCYMVSSSYNILPPIESAQITLKDFYFKYGVVEIRAKLPSGDWIYPQLWLEPKFKEYGQLFNSGRIILASTHGNRELLTSDGKDISSKVLKAGFVLGAQEKVFGKSALFEKKTGSWSDEFHNFTFVWKPNSFEVIVDGKVQELLNQNSQSIANEFKFTKEERESVWPSTSSNAPFDKSFSITLGVAVGGRREFPDDTTTKNFHKKPWKNVGSVKRLLNFWKDKNNWFSTWTDKDSALQVDYVKVIAL